MKIISTAVASTTKRVDVTINYHMANYKFTVKLVDGKVQGDFKNGIQTSQLVYFEFPESIRKEHFEAIKIEVESKGY